MNTELTTAIEVITPAKSAEYLQHNAPWNRTVHKKAVEKYARDMKNGDFKLTHQGIAFDTDGHLIDGRHRLTAVLISGKPITCLVTRNVDSDAMSLIDRGTSRTVRDSLTIANPGMDTVSKVLKHAAVPAVLRQLVVCSTKEMSLSVSEITKVFNVFHEQMIALFGLTNAKHNGANRCQLLSAAIAAMYCGVPTEAIDKFFQVFRRADITDCAGFNVNAALDWRRQIDEAKYHGSRMPGDRVFLGTQNAIYNFVNNTDVKRIVVPKEHRYNVTGVVKEALKIG